MISMKKLWIGLAVGAAMASVGTSALSLPEEEEHYNYYADASLTGPRVGKRINSCSGRSYISGEVTPYMELVYTFPCYVYGENPNL